MKKLLVFVVAIFLVLFGQGFAVAGLIEYTGGNSGWQIQAHEPIGQSFTAEDEYVDTVGLRVADDNIFVDPTDLSIVIQLYAGKGDFSNNALLREATVTLPYENYIGWADLDVRGLTFTVGASYTIAVKNNNARWFVRGGNHGYAGGDAYTFGNLTNLDLDFHVIPSPEGEGGGSGCFIGAVTDGLGR
jgi:hypothetical protein